MKEHHKKESPVISMLGFGGGGTGTAFGGVAGPKIYIDDVFDIHSWLGGGAFTVNNGIDMATEGGMVMKATRNTSGQNYGFTINDTEMGAQKRFWPMDGQNGEASQSDSITAFNTNGWSQGNNSYENGSNNTNVAWTFRKCPKFFDIVEYTGNGGNARTVDHNLDSRPAVVWIWARTSNHGRGVLNYHYEGKSNSDGANSLTEGTTAASASFNTTSTQLVLWDSGTGFGWSPNANGVHYTAYLFAGRGDDDAVFGEGGNESIIKCGKLAVTQGSGVQEVTLGWEPGLIIAKTMDEGSGEAGYWYWNDFMRMMATNEHANLHSQNHSGYSNYRNEEEKNYAGWVATPTGFKFDKRDNGTYQNMDGNLAYIAIRKPGMKPATAASEVFGIKEVNNQNNTVIDYPITPDLLISRRIDANGAKTMFVDRARGDNWRLDSTSQERQLSDHALIDLTRTNKLVLGNDAANAQGQSGLFGNNYLFEHYLFKRSPGFFDIVTWGETSSSTPQVTHNLDAVPEMVITKMRNYGNNQNYSGDKWYCYHKDLGNSNGGAGSAPAWDSHLGFNQNASQISSSGQGIFSATPTATNLPFDNPSSDSLAVGGNTNATYVGYLFGSKAGISKVGSYTPSVANSTQFDVSLGFTPRFLMIKSVERTGDWYVFDSERNFTVGSTNPKPTKFNTTDQEENINPVLCITNGFRVAAGAPAALHTQGERFIYLAIA
jgi:hypothetical protein